VCGQLYAPAAAPTGQEPRYPLYRGLSGPQSQSGRGGDEKKSHHCHCLELNPRHPVHSLVTILSSFG